MCSDQRIIFYCNSHWLLAVVPNILYLVSNLCSLFFAFCSLLFDLFCLLSGTIWYLVFLCLPFSLSALYFCSPLFLGFPLLSALPCYTSLFSQWIIPWFFNQSIEKCVLYMHIYYTQGTFTPSCIYTGFFFLLLWQPYLWYKWTNVFQQFIVPVL